MAISKVVLECPFCSEIVEAESPDKLHAAYSTEKPLAKTFYDKVVEEELKCQNPKCKKHIKVYWYAPLDYFNRI